MIYYPYANLNVYTWLVPLTVILIVSAVMLAVYFDQTRHRR